MLPQGKRKKKPRTRDLLFKGCKGQLISLYIVLLVEESPLNPNGSSAEILWEPPVS
jgi:hypothetical protein